jgi:hypothetical protein
MALRQSTRALWLALSASWIELPHAQARPDAPAAMCSRYPDIPTCLGRVPSCTTCHDSTDPPSWNAYGEEVRAALDPARPFAMALPDALEATAEADSDGDGASNAEELRAGTSPADASSTPDALGDEPPGPNPVYSVGKYDVAFALRRVLSLYCGRSPTYEELQQLRAQSEHDARETLHAALAACLDGAFWRTQALPRLADKRIKPVAAAGIDTKIEIRGYRLVIGDYHDDYNLWTYVLTDDRDMRDLLTATYHVRKDAEGRPQRVEGVLPKTDETAIAGAQLLEPRYRAGMLTTQWFLSVNTMFAALPRVTAAQAYRAYLGNDISLNEGLMPVEGEPTDIDDKGVDDPRCANCHSTLDPLAYAFARYDGISTGGLSVGNFGVYAEDRPTRLMAGWQDSVQQPYIFGQQVTSLVEWAKVASESDAFKRTMTQAFFAHALGRPPVPRENEEFTTLWRSLPEDGYSANRLLHRLVDTLSFGAP